MATQNNPGSRPTDRPFRALVLPGGGGRGAYQVGVSKALMERGIEFDLAFGTSIGGINATLMTREIFSDSKICGAVSAEKMFSRCPRLIKSAGWF